MTLPGPAVDLPPELTDVVEAVRAGLEEVGATVEDSLLLPAPRVAGPTRSGEALGECVHLDVRSAGGRRLVLRVSPVAYRAWPVGSRSTASGPAGVADSTGDGLLAGPEDARALGASVEDLLAASDEFVRDASAAMRSIGMGDASAVVPARAEVLRRFAELIDGLAVAEALEGAASVGDLEERVRARGYDDERVRVPVADALAGHHAESEDRVLAAERFLRDVEAGTPAEWAARRALLGSPSAASRGPSRRVNRPRLPRP